MGDLIKTYEKCDPNCAFFPDMSCLPGNWEYDDDGIKRRLNKKVFKCIYDGHMINWNVTCPRYLKGE